MLGCDGNARSSTHAAHLLVKLGLQRARHARQRLGVSQKEAEHALERLARAGGGEVVHAAVQHTPADDVLEARDPERQSGWRRRRRRQRRDADRDRRGENLRHYFA
eukprot:4345124-Prymnesium_polylepis.2